MASCQVKLASGANQPSHSTVCICSYLLHCCMFVLLSTMLLLCILNEFALHRHVTWKHYFHKLMLCLAWENLLLKVAFQLADVNSVNISCYQVFQFVFLWYVYLFLYFIFSLVLVIICALVRNLVNVNVMVLYSTALQNWMFYKARCSTQFETYVNSAGSL